MTQTGMAREPAGTTRSRDIGPVTSGLGPALETARAYGVWKGAQRLGDDDGALAVLEGMDVASDGDGRDTRIVEMRLWEAEKRLARREIARPQALLRAVEATAGQSWRSRLLAARLARSDMDFEGCVALCAEAIVLCDQADDTAQVRDLWVEAANLMDEPERATPLTRTAAPGTPLGRAEVGILRQTVDDPIRLDRFCALLADQFRLPGPEGRAALYHYSMACRDLGLHDRAIAAVRRRFLKGVAGETWGSHKAKPRESGWVDDATVALRDLKTAMDAAGAPFFLISGTLLGCVREGGVLGHDKDIDVGVMETPGLDREPVHEALSASGVFLLKPYRNLSLLRLQHANGVLIDVFWHRLEGGRVIHEGDRAKWWNTPFDLVATDFLGQRHLIPADPARYLGENYGDWEKSDPSFETFVDTPNMIVTNPPAMVWYFYNKLLDYYVLGKSAQFRKVFGRLRLTCPEDHEVRDIGHRVLAMIEH